MRNPTDIVEDHEAWRGSCINLIPSENVMSPQARSLLTSDMGHRYTLPGITEMDGIRVENAYRGTKFMDEVERLAVDLAREIYDCEYACVRPLSGHISVMIALTAACQSGDPILAVDFNRGGYPGYDKEELAGLLGLKVGMLPFDDKEWDLNYDGCLSLIRNTSIAAAIVGTSKMLFPPRILALSGACRESGTKLLYDASHVLGLIAGNSFGDPLEEGADLVYGSTHKTLFGPQGGLVLTNDLGLADRIEDRLHWKTLDNAHWNRIACLAQALLEVREFGEAYAKQVVANAKRLAKAVEKKGLPVLCPDRGYTASHQVGLQGSQVARELGAGSFEEVTKKLENADIIVDCVGRLGTCEVTRLGMVEADMDTIADLLSRTVVEGEDPASVREDVHRFRAGFQKPRFCFD